MVSAVGYIECHEIKVARFGDNMRNVAVTDGDKIEAEIQFGWTVDYFDIGDVVKEIEKVTTEEVNDTYQTCQKLYDFEYGNNSQEYFEEHLKEQIKIEIALRRFLDAGGYTAFTTN